MTTQLVRSISDFIPRNINWRVTTRRYTWHVQKRWSSTKLVSFPLADIGEGIYDVELIYWSVKAGEYVEEFSPLCEVRSDKATAEITSRHAGTVKRLYCNVGDRHRIGEPLVDIEIKTNDVDPPKSILQENEVVRENSSKSRLIREQNRLGNKKFLATPKIRHLVNSSNLTEEEVSELKRIGRVHEADVLGIINGRRFAEGVDKEHATEAVRLKSRTVNLSTVRETMAKRMQKSLQVPSFSASDEIKMNHFLEYSKKLTKDERFSRTVRENTLYQELTRCIPESPQYRFSILPLLVKIISESIKQYPVINSQYISASETRVIENHNIGIAIDTPNGLIVPTIKNVDQKSVIDIYVHLYRLIALAKKRKLLFEDLHGGTFTISNIGSIGSTSSQPIVVPPEVCILSLGRIQKLPRFSSTGEIYEASIANINCSADHRVLDGAYLVRFMNKIRSMAENPAVLDKLI